MQTKDSIPLDALVIQQGGYDVIYVDPPWSYKFSEPTATKGGTKGSGYSAGVNYYYPLIGSYHNMKSKK